MQYVLLLSALTLILTSACGYQPVRSLDIRDSLQPVYIRENSPLAIEIKRQLIAEGIETSPSLALANSIVELRGSSIQGRNLTVNVEGRNAEVLMQARAHLVWREPGGNVILEQPLGAETLQVANPDKPLAARNENEQITNNLNRDIARQAIRLMHQVQSASSAPGLQNTPSATGKPEQGLR